MHGAYQPWAYAAILGLELIVQSSGSSPRTPVLSIIVSVHINRLDASPGEGALVPRTWYTRTHHTCKSVRAQIPDSQTTSRIAAKTKTTTQVSKKITPRS